MRCNPRLQHLTRCHNALTEREREFFIENLLVRIHLIIEMILVERLGKQLSTRIVQDAALEKDLFGRNLVHTKVKPDTSTWHVEYRGCSKIWEGPMKVDIRLPETGDSNSHGARPAY